MGQINIGSLDISYAKPEKAAGQKEAKDVTGDFKKLLGDGAKQEVDSQSGNETKLQSGQDTAEGTANDSAPDSGKSEEMLLGMQMGQLLWGMQNVQNLQNQQPAEVTPEAEAVIKPEAVNGIPGQIAAEEISAEDMITESQNAPEQPTEEVKPEFVWEVPVKEASVNEKPDSQS